MALKLLRAEWVKFATPISGQNERTLHAVKCTVLNVHVESRQAFYATVQRPEVRSALIEEWQLAEGEFERLTGYICPDCGQAFENTQAIGKHRVSVHGKTQAKGCST